MGVFGNKSQKSYLNVFLKALLPAQKRQMQGLFLGPVASPLGPLLAFCTAQEAPARPCCRPLCPLTARGAGQAKVGRGWLRNCSGGGSPSQAPSSRSGGLRKKRVVEAARAAGTGQRAAGATQVGSPGKAAPLHRWPWAVCKQPSVFGRGSCQKKMLTPASWGCLRAKRGDGYEARCLQSGFKSGDICAGSA